MSLVPIKLLKNKVNRTRLLGLKGETEEIDKEDFIESRINTNAKAKNLLAIELSLIHISEPTRPY